MGLRLSGSLAGTATGDTFGLYGRDENVVWIEECVPNALVPFVITYL